MKTNVSNGSLALAGLLVILGLKCLLTGQAGYRTASAEGIHIRVGGSILVLVGIIVIITWFMETIRTRKINKKTNGYNPKQIGNSIGVCGPPKGPFEH